MAVIKYLDENLEQILMSFLLAMMVLLSGLQVFFRYFVNSSLAWSEELSRYCYVWSGFLSLSYCVRKGSSLKLDFLMSAIPGRARRFAALLASVFSIWIYAIFLYSAVIIIQKTGQIQQVSAALRIPMQAVYMAAAVGFALAIVRAAQMSLSDIRLMFEGSAGGAARTRKEEEVD
jgi:TRAP-type C4-dicarboxylate transport system permease small subunit